MDQGRSLAGDTQDPSILKQDVREYLTAENTYFDEMMGGTIALRDKLFEEMKGRIKQDARPD